MGMIAAFMQCSQLSWFLILFAYMVLLGCKLLMFVLFWMQDLYIQVWISVRGYAVSLLLGGIILISNLKALDDLELSWAYWKEVGMFL